jgi:hypothetical protein
MIAAMLKAATIAAPNEVPILSHKDALKGADELIAAELATRSVAEVVEDEQSERTDEEIDAEWLRDMKEWEDERPKSRRKR